jgi:LmbE family N-acetylglucosaminyl deacetylase
VAILEETRPKLIFVPFITDIHPDHVLLARILAAALGRWSEPGTIVLGYEIWSRVPANAWCDVGSVMADLEQQLLLYETAMKVDDFVHGCAARNYANALLLAGRSGFVEAFFQCDVTTYRSLVEPVPGGP